VELRLSHTIFMSLMPQPPLIISTFNSHAYSQPTNRIPYITHANIQLSVYTTHTTHANTP